MLGHFSLMFSLLLSANGILNSRQFPERHSEQCSKVIFVSRNGAFYQYLYFQSMNENPEEQTTALQRSNHIRLRTIVVLTV